MNKNTSGEGSKKMKNSQCKEEFPDIFSQFWREDDPIF